MLCHLQAICMPCAAAKKKMPVFVIAARSVPGPVACWLPEACLARAGSRVRRDSDWSDWFGRSRRSSSMAKPGTLAANVSKGLEALRSLNSQEHIAVSTTAPESSPPSTGVRQLLHSQSDREARNTQRTTLDSIAESVPRVPEGALQAFADLPQSRPADGATSPAVCENTVAPRVPAAAPASVQADLQPASAPAPIAAASEVPGAALLQRPQSPQPPQPPQRPSSELQREQSPRRRDSTCVWGVNSTLKSSTPLSGPLFAHSTFMQAERLSSGTSASSSALLNCIAETIVEGDEDAECMTSQSSAGNSSGGNTISALGQSLSDASDGAQQAGAAAGSEQALVTGAALHGVARNSAQGLIDSSGRSGDVAGLPILSVPPMLAPLGPQAQAELDLWSLEQRPSWPLDQRPSWAIMEDIVEEDEDEMNAAMAETSEAESSLASAGSSMKAAGRGAGVRAGSNSPYRHGDGERKAAAAGLDERRSHSRDASSEARTRDGASARKASTDSGALSLSALHGVLDHVSSGHDSASACDNWLADAGRHSPDLELDEASAMAPLRMSSSATAPAAESVKAAGQANGSSSGNGGGDSAAVPRALSFSEPDGAADGVEDDVNMIRSKTQLHTELGVQRTGMQ
jgi:hypothetical protein